MFTISHGVFTTIFNSEMQSSYEANKNQEALILGAVFLFWKHNKNIAYLNSAIQYARGRRGIRVNAVKAFLIQFTGAVYKQGKGFTKAGRKLKDMPEEFAALNSWLDWADKNVQEPEYNLAKQQLKVVSFLQHQKKVAQENNQDSMTVMLEASIEAYAQAEQKTASVLQAS